MPLAAMRSFVGVAKEVTPGTVVVPTHYVPITNDTNARDNINYLQDKGMRGSMVKYYNVVPGIQQGDLQLQGNVDLKTIGFSLASMLGDVATTGAGPYTHTFSVKNSTDGQPPSYTFTDYNGVEARAYSFGRATECVFKFNADGLFEYTSKWKSFASVTASTPTPSYSTYVPFANYVATVAIAGGTSLIVQDGEVAIKRSVDALGTLNNGNANPYKLFSGAVEVSGKLTVVAESSAELVRYLTNTQPSLSLIWKVPAVTDSLTLFMTKAAYTAVEAKRGKEWVQYDIKFDGIANTTDAGASGGYSPMKATLINTEIAATYA